MRRLVAFDRVLVGPSLAEAGMGGGPHPRVKWVALMEGVGDIGIEAEDTPRNAATIAINGAGLDHLIWPVVSNKAKATYQGPLA